MGLYGYSGLTWSKGPKCATVQARKVVEEDAYNPPLLDSDRSAYRPRPIWHAWCSCAQGQARKVVEEDAYNPPLLDSDGAYAGPVVGKCTLYTPPIHPPNRPQKGPNDAIYRVKKPPPSRHMAGLCPGRVWAGTREAPFDPS